jgi:hypothetical protein
MVVMPVGLFAVVERTEGLRSLRSSNEQSASFGDRTQIDGALHRDLVESHGVVIGDVAEAVLDRVARDRERRHELRHVVLGSAWADGAPSSSWCPGS